MALSLSMHFGTAPCTDHLINRRMFAREVVGTRKVVLEYTIVLGDQEPDWLLMDFKDDFRLMNDYTQEDDPL